MAETILFNIATEVLKNLGSAALAEIASAWGFKSRLEKLKSTINTLKDVLLDAEERQAGSHAIRGWLERLTTVVYAADDLFDEFATTLVARKQQFCGNRVTKEVRTFFSSSNQVVLAFKISHNIKNIRQQLDDIVQEGNQFSFVLQFHDKGSVINTSRKRDETYSFVDTDEVIGRDGDKKAVLDLLLPSSTIDECELFPVIPIVGMGGMGKSTLAQLIYNDPLVQDCFELKLWVCVSVVFDIKAIIEKVFMSATKSEAPKVGINLLQEMLRKRVSDKKYLLVLDDVWNENREDWLKLRALLKIGRSGSKILVTTRSRKVAKIMGTVSPYELQGLSKESSWDLFEKVAFEPGQALQKPYLVKIGEGILKKCGDVPLAIRTLGILLYGEDDNKWLIFNDASLLNISDNPNNIINILKLSYQHLYSPLKKCFAYCALFPKGHWFDKEMLIDLWMAEGFIIPDAKKNQSLDKVAEQYFLTLLQRGFFQDIIMNEWGDIESCKMHDFMHDLAQEVAGLKCKVADIDEVVFDENILHLSFACSLNSSWEIPVNILNLKRLRTFLLPEGVTMMGEPTCQQLLSRLCTLRVLDLNNLGLESLPSSIDKLIHLRYLNLSRTPIQELPDSITDLLNLQTLKLNSCTRLKTLPINLRLLTNLRCLDVSWCCELSHMPPGIGGLTLLSKLPYFIVGHKYCRRTLGSEASSAKLSDLKNLNNLRGELDIVIYIDFENMLEADLSCKHGLTNLKINFDVYGNGDCGSDRGFDHDKAVLEGLKRHSSIKRLCISNYRGQKLPSWAKLNNLCITLPNLVIISLKYFRSCEEIPTMSQLRFLKQLKIENIESVEYMEGNISSSLFFPSLQVLHLERMTNLKGWWKEGEAMESHTDLEDQVVPKSMQFSKLSKLRLVGCRNLRMLPICPNLEHLDLRYNNDSLSVSKMVTTMTMSNSSYSGSPLKLKRLVIENVEDFMSLPNHCLQQLSYLQINTKKLESSESLRKVFATLSSSLRTLEFIFCEKLRSVSKGLEHLTALEKLKFRSCEELELTGKEDEDDGNGMPWISLNTSLRSLELYDLDKLVGLPSGLQNLSNLRSLELSCNDKLKELPEWISCLTCLTYLKLYRCPELKCLPVAFRNLTTLNQLRVKGCPGLTERCRSPNGSDWPKIQHIPFVYVTEN